MSTDSFRIEDLEMHARWLRRLARALAADGSGDDLVQDTMLAAWQRAPGGARPCAPGCGGC